FFCVGVILLQIGDLFINRHIFVPDSWIKIQMFRCGIPSILHDERNFPIIERPEYRIYLWRSKSDEGTLYGFGKIIGLLCNLRLSVHNARLPELWLAPSPHSRSSLRRLRNRKFVDSSLEETVRSELVSLSEFPVSRELTGNLRRFGLRARKWPQITERYQDFTSQFPTHWNREFISA